MQGNSEGELQDTFQLVISTDGRVSFAAFIYINPAVVFSNIHKPEEEENGDLRVSAAIGFDADERSLAADFGLFLLRNNRTLETVNIFRIDGMSRISNKIKDQHIRLINVSSSVLNSFWF